jgi:hypothetical protein
MISQKQIEQCSVLKIDKDRFQTLQSFPRKLSSDNCDCAEFRQSSETSPFLYVLIPVFSITYQWQRNCAGLGKSLSQRDQMLRIQKEANGQVVLKVSGRLDGEGLSELKVLIESEVANRHIVLDLRELTLVDRETVRFLEHCDSNGIELQNCPPYICEWIARQRDGK